MGKRCQESPRLPYPAGGALQAYLSYANGPGEWAVLYVHGFSSTRSGEKSVALEEACARRNWTFVSFDFRGHGESTGSLLELRGSGLLEDLDTIREWLASRGVTRLCLVGSSMGGWAAAWFAASRPETVQACVLIAPAFNFLRLRWDRMTEEERNQWRETGRLRIHGAWSDVEIGYGGIEELDQFPVGHLAARLSRPTLIFHGMLDDVVPYTNSLAFLELAVHPGIELRLFKNGDHRLLPLKDTMAEAACDFFQLAVHPLPS
jgi:pimeloyl-ACP methyl ester carboxylesterase